MSKYIILSTSDHPFFETFKSAGVEFYDLEKDEPFEGRKSNYRECDAVIDLSQVAPDRKLSFLKYLDFEFQTPIISDLSCFWGDFYMEQVAHLEGAVSLIFPGMGNSFECYHESGVAEDAINWMGKHIRKTPHNVSAPGIGFTFPRTLALIINEAFFSLEDKMASAEDIDRAMKFGLNFPKGPFEWLSMTGPGPVLQLLDELYNVTGDPRYRASKLLRIEASQSEG